MAGAKAFVDAKIRQRKVMLFSKRNDPSCQLVRNILDSYKIKPENYEVCEIDRRQDCTVIENHFLVICLTSGRTMPRLFINGRYITSDPIDIDRMHQDGQLRELLEDFVDQEDRPQASMNPSDDIDHLNTSD